MNLNKVNTGGRSGKKDAGMGRDRAARVAAREPTARKKRPAVKIEPRREKPAGGKNETNSGKILRWTGAQAQNRGPKTRSTSYKGRQTAPTKCEKDFFIESIMDYNMKF
jgi:hypothetical protein